MRFRWKQCIVRATKVTPRRGSWGALAAEASDRSAEVPRCRGSQTAGAKVGTVVGDASQNLSRIRTLPGPKKGGIPSAPVFRATGAAVGAEGGHREPTGR